MREADEHPARSSDPARQTPRRDRLDQSVEESFPASDAPSWAPLHVGAPGEHPDPPPTRPEPTEAVSERQARTPTEAT